MPILKRLTALAMTMCAASCGGPQASPEMTAPVGVAGDITISEPRLRLPANGRDQSAAYMTLTNQGTTPDRLMGAFSPQADRLELHTNAKSSDGMVTMRELDHIDIPARTSIALTPGALHIMVKGIKQDLKLGETMTIGLTFASGKSAQFQVPVVANPSGSDESKSNSPKSHDH